ncbi:MAG: response regulator [Alphaproteobacteria bacterium]
MQFNAVHPNNLRSAPEKNGANKENNFDLSVLLIDDQSETTKFLGKLLHGNNIRTFYANDGRQALDLLGKPNAVMPDLIICDIYMPNMCGMEFCNSMRLAQNRDLRRIPIIVLTGDYNTELDEVLQQINVLKVVRKPISLKDLTKVIYDTIGFKKYTYKNNLY